MQFKHLYDEPSKLVFVGGVMFLRSAIGRNLFAVISTGLITVAVTASALTWLSYNQMRERSLGEMQSAADATAIQVRMQLLPAQDLAHSLRSAIYAAVQSGNATRESMDLLLGVTTRKC